MVSCWQAAAVSKRRGNGDSVRAGSEQKVRGKSPVAALAQGSLLSSNTQHNGDVGTMCVPVPVCANHWVAMLMGRAEQSMALKVSRTQ